MNKTQYVAIGLFDGLSGGRLATDAVEHIDIARYYSSEVDKYAIQVADHNYPQDTRYRLGDIRNIDGYKLLAEIKKDFPNAKILLLGGSPCQGFSMAGKLKGSSTKCGKDVTTLEQYLILKEMNFEFDGQSYLFWEFVRLQKEVNPDYFMLENVRVTKKWIPMFNKAMNVEPTRINSSLVSAQNRDRFYWHNLGKIEQPEDQGILLKDILDNAEVNYNSESLVVPEATKKGYIEVKPGDCFDNCQPKSKTRRGRDMSKKSNALLTSNGFVQYLGRPCELREFKEESICHHTATATATDIKGNESIKRVYAESGKAPAMTTCQGGHREPKVLIDKIKNINPSGNGMNGNVYGTDAKSATYRKLTPLECERLQTLPDGYTLVLDEKGKQLVSNSQRYKMIGNGWTIAVVIHILKHLP